MNFVNGGNGSIIEREIVEKLALLRASSRRHSDSANTTGNVSYFPYITSFQLKQIVLEHPGGSPDFYTRFIRVFQKYCKVTSLINIKVGTKKPMVQGHESSAWHLYGTPLRISWGMCQLRFISYLLSFDLTIRHAEKLKLKQKTQRY